MDGLTLIGVSHRRGGTDALEAYARAYAARPVGERLAAIGVRAYFALETCNRVDVACVRPAGVSPATLRRALTVDAAARAPYLYADEAAFEQLARVAASLDSLNPGEDQILRQVRDAATAARAAGHVDATLSFAIDAALRIAKAVRREVALAPRDASLYGLARPEVEAALAAAGDRPRALVLGAGEMAALVVRALAPLPGVALTVANRDGDRARALAAEHGARGCSLADLRAHAIDADVLVSAVAGGRVVGPELLSAMPALRLAVDLGVPRTIDAEAARARGVRVVDVDALRSAGEVRRRELDARLAQAERVLLDGLDRERRAWAERSLAPSIRALQGWLAAALEDELPPAAAKRVARRLAFVPVKGLRALAREHGVAVARTFLAETGLDRPAEVPEP